MSLTLLGVSWLWWAIGTFGIVGTALMIWLAPAAFVAIARVVVTFLVTNRWGNMIAVAIVVFFIADVNRSILDTHAFEQKTAAFERAQKQRDKQIAADTRESVTKELADQAAANAATEKQVEDFHNALPPTPPETANPFLVGTDSCKLRQLAGQVGCGPASHQAVPAPRAPAKATGDHRRLGLSGRVRHLLGRDSKGQGGQQSPR